MIYHIEDYRDVLRLGYEERHGRNGAYSLRAYARDLGVSVSRLSEVLSRRHHLSVATADKIARKLDLDDDERSYFRDLVAKQTAKSETERSQASTRLLKYKFADEESQLRMDHFRLISDWYHFAILELFKTKDFRCDIKWIAKALGIEPKTVRAALVRLERLEFVEKTGGVYELRKPRSFTDCLTPSEALRRFHRQILERAAQALDIQPRSERISLGAVAAVDAADIEELREDVKALITAFVTKRAKQAEADHVYCLTVQAFRMDGDSSEP